MRKWITAVLILTSLCLIYSPMSSLAKANSIVRINEVSIELGGDRYSVTLTKPVYINNGRVLLPVREIGQNASLRTFWNATSKTVSLYGAEHTIQLTIGSKTAMVDGKKTSLDVPAQIINGVTYLPLKFIASGLKQTVSWDAANRSIYLPSSYVMGMDQNLTYWINRDTKNIYQAIGQQKGKMIGKVKIDLYYSTDVEVKKLSDSSAYIKATEAVGVDNRIRTTDRLIAANHKIIKEGFLPIVGDFIDTSIDTSNGEYVFTNGKQTDFVTPTGKQTSSYNLAQKLNPDYSYLVEHAEAPFLIVREYETQHLIVYNRETGKAVYLHEVLNLPAKEKQFLIQAAADRSEYTSESTIITFVKNNNGTLSFRYKFPSDNSVHVYTYKLD
ncbi:copper amine oxidase N-terminal domain-containing protein [Paenibacillus kandeliae]|uniref:copper amine oxidase N-terminal domain-containing protein n=1 Tax=Paenibacillus kandeliae TaxID=3231269 RepID=UPI00345B0C48